MTTLTPYKLSPIHSWHLEHNAVFTDCNGWQWASAYATPPLNTEPSGLLVCDLSPLTRVSCKKDCAGSLIALCPQAEALESGKAVKVILAEYHAWICRPVDDEYIVIGPAQAHSQLVNDLLSHRTSASVQDITGSTALFLMQGTGADTAFSYLSSLDVHFNAFPAVSATYTSYCFARTLVIRTETGFYLMPPSDYADFVWRSLLDAGEPSGIQVVGYSALEPEDCLL